MQIRDNNNSDPESQEIDEDFELIRLVNEGDQNAFAKLIGRHKDKVRNLVFLTLGDAEFVDDISQDVFISIYKKLGDFRFESKFTTWLYRITVNEAINFSKRENRSSEISEQIIANEGDPDKIYEEMELKKKIHDAIMQLDILYRLPIVLKHLFDYSYKELSYVLDIPEKTVKSRLFTGRQLLKEILTNNRV